jgi:hypothetical protein
MLFNKQSTEARVKEVKNKYNELCGDWSPRQTNGYELYKAAGSDWKKVDISQFKTISWSDSWLGMPKAAEDYLQSLPEFDATIFKEITELVLGAETPSLSGKTVSVTIDGKAYQATIL